MANEISFRYTSGLTLYAHRINQHSQIYMPASGNYELPVDADWSLYTIPLIEQGHTGYYLGTSLTIIGSGDFVNVFQQATSSPAETDTLVGTIESETYYIQSALVIQQYADRQTAQAYFNTRLHTKPWDSATAADQQKSLVQATRQIDRLNFSGKKISDSQVLEFPRMYKDNDVFRILNFDFFDEFFTIRYPGFPVPIPDADDVISTAIPSGIIYACCEIALKLLDDYDIDKEAKEISLAEQHFITIRTRRDTSFVQDHVLAGIPSLVAWNYLKPYLQDPNQISLSRVN